MPAKRMTPNANITRTYANVTNINVVPSSSNAAHESATISTDAAHVFNVLPATPVIDKNADVGVAGAATVNNNHSVGVKAPLPSNRAQWSTVEKKKRKNLNKKTVWGANTNIELEVAVRHKWLHLSSFSKSVTEDNIIDYVAKHSTVNKNSMSCYKLVKKGTPDADLKRINFKLGVPEYSFDSILNSDLWPVNVAVRPFRFFEKTLPDHHTA
ncbi:PREDICTED: uncharacterized protein LOC108360840 [Rhagoletis zephyria]|uniref:uncharacterized protein LOC108360840 n=1 Tax=Rhagoletis zephyria TaxID=28612 RepID=UPI0008114EFE|nr:PREDICTED: uncharacterized protein LOC108360840 [Rhagoletis zephyria]